MSIASAVSPAEDRIRLLYRMRARELFWRMMTRQGINPAGIWWHGMEDMVARATANCAACPHTASCRSWFDHPSGERIPRFCPNQRAIEACRIMDPVATPLIAEKVPSVSPTLVEVLEEPIVKKLMAADGVNSEILRRAMTDTPRFTAAYASPAP